MKIALIRQRYTPYGGAERFVARAMEALEQQGAQLTIVSRSWQPDGKTSALICNPFYLGSVWRDWSFARCVCQLLAKEQFDLVQSHERISCCDIYRAGDGVHREWLKQRRRSMQFFGKLGLVFNPYHHYTLAAERKLFASPSLKAVICNSQMVKAEIQHYFGLPEDMIHVIYSGIDTSVFHPGLSDIHRASLRAEYGIPQESRLFLFVGSGFERKGLHTLIKAMANTAASCHLMVVGKDKKLERYRQFANSLGLSDRIHFAGGKTDPKPFYGAADAYVLPTLYDPFPNTVLEAFASGLPVVTSTKSGGAELVRDAENGFVCDALDVNKLSGYLNQLAGMNLSDMRLAASETVKSLSLENMGAKLISLYNTLLEAPSAQSTSEPL